MYYVVLIDKPNGLACMECSVGGEACEFGRSFNQTAVWLLCDGLDTDVDFFLFVLFLLRSSFFRHLLFLSFLSSFLSFVFLLRSLYSSFSSSSFVVSSSFFLLLLSSFLFNRLTRPLLYPGVVGVCYGGLTRASL